MTVLVTTGADSVMVWTSCEAVMVLVMAGPCIVTVWACPGTVTVPVITEVDPMTYAVVVIAVVTGVADKVRVLTLVAYEVTVLAGCVAVEVVVM